MKLLLSAKKFFIQTSTLAAFIFSLSAVLLAPARAELADFCDKLPRAAYEQFTELPVSNDWFKVYSVSPGIWAIYEPYQWQEVISYLIEGEERALLFDTGNGIGDIKAITDQLVDKPLIVLNSHSHFDHIGGNYQFSEVLSLNTEFSNRNSKGRQDADTAMEVSDDALCHGLPEGLKPEDHRLRAYTATEWVAGGDTIDLGGRTLEIIHLPGHTPDAIALIDRDSGFLWTGDSFYEGPIWLYAPETDLALYRESLAKMVALVPSLKALFPAHNTPMVDPEVLVDVQKAFNQVLAGAAQPVPTWPGTVTFEFDGFGFLMREDYTRLE
ncbi:MAG: MBL fold metallo-hydrolase [Halioglobus sp.]